MLVTQPVALPFKPCVDGHAAALAAMAQKQNRQMPKTFHQKRIYNLAR